MSGGGANGLAHIGVLKALEERGIPIDYITGTSAGALVGAMYAVGFSPEEIEHYVLSDDFQLLAKGRLKTTQRFYYKEDEVNAGLVDFSFSLDSTLSKSLPTNLLKSTFLDFEMLKFLGVTSASRGNNFDSLFVPYRCLASDIRNKKSIVFSSGNLNQAVRASMTYPFYFNPIRVNGLLMFDGGLYNNFPADVIYNEFAPDYIIGSNVSDNAGPPSENSLVSQLTNMLVSNSTYALPCEYGILIEPKTSLGTFEFERVKEAIDNGYNTTLLYIDSILPHIKKLIPKATLNVRREKFRTALLDLTISSISTNHLREKEISYATQTLLNARENERIDGSKLEKRYYRLYATSQIDFIYPTLYLKPDSTYHLFLDIRKAKNFKVDFGGHFSSRAINTGYFGVNYRMIGRTATTIHGSTYFGKFYGSAKASYTIDIPAVTSFAASAYFVLNRWDYFKSFATFFEDIKPSYIVQNEMYYGLKVISPINNSTKSVFDFRVFQLRDEYYQTKNFSSKDTADRTYFNGQLLSWELAKNSLNRKQFASRGSLFKLRVRYVSGIEKTIPGSTSNSNTTTSTSHSWLNLTGEIQSFIVNNSFIHLGIHSKGVLSTQTLFSNYTASSLNLPSFALVPDAETYFLQEYRSPQFLGLGVNAIFSVFKSLDLRFDVYYYQPFKVLTTESNGTVAYAKPAKNELMMGSTSLIYHSFLGPLRLSVNYFPKQTNPVSFQLSYGFVIFNERAIR